jgi:hypothetical protein
VAQRDGIRLIFGEHTEASSPYPDLVVATCTSGWLAPSVAGAASHRGNRLHAAFGVPENWESAVT